MMIGGWRWNATKFALRRFEHRQFWQCGIKMNDTEASSNGMMTHSDFKQHLCDYNTEKAAGLCASDTPMHWAAANGNAALVEKLVAAGAPGVHAYGWSGGRVFGWREHYALRCMLPVFPARVTSLYSAARNGHLEVVRSLLKAGACSYSGMYFIGFQYLSEICPLQAAAENGHAAVVEELLIKQRFHWMNGFHWDSAHDGYSKYNNYNMATQAVFRASALQHPWNGDYRDIIAMFPHLTCATLFLAVLLGAVGTTTMVGYVTIGTITMVFDAVKAFIYWNRSALRRMVENDKEVMLAAVKQNGRALRLASAELQNDKEVVLAAVKHDGQALRYASAELWKDKEVVKLVVKQKAENYRKQKCRMTAH
jgi:hypothetical protein